MDNRVADFAKEIPFDQLRSDFRGLRDSPFDLYEFSQLVGSQLSDLFNFVEVEERQGEVLSFGVVWKKRVDERGRGLLESRLVFVVLVVDDLDHFHAAEVHQVLEVHVESRGSVFDDVLDLLVIDLDWNLLVSDSVDFLEGVEEVLEELAKLVLGGLLCRGVKHRLYITLHYNNKSGKCYK